MVAVRTAACGSTGDDCQKQAMPRLDRGVGRWLRLDGTDAPGASRQFLGFACECDDPTYEIPHGRGGRSVSLSSYPRVEIEIGYFDARRNLQVGNEASQQQLDGLIAKLPLLPQLIERTWQPVLHYWYGVALSRRSPEDAEEVFRKLCSGPKASPARIQLALLAIKREDLPSAQRWISDASPCFPGALYVQGLLYQRQGKVSEARQTLSLIMAV